MHHIKMKHKMRTKFLRYTEHIRKNESSWKAYIFLPGHNVQDRKQPQADSGSSSVSILTEVHIMHATAPRLLIENELIIIQQHSLREMDIPQFYAKKNRLALLYKFMRQEWHDAMLREGPHPANVRSSLFRVRKISRIYFSVESVLVFVRNVQCECGNTR